MYNMNGLGGKKKNICMNSLKFGARWFVYDGRICSLQLLLAWTVCTPADGFLFQPFQCKYFRWQRQTPGLFQLLSVFRECWSAGAFMWECEYTAEFCVP